MTVTIEIKQTGLQSTLSGLRELINLQRQLQGLQRQTGTRSTQRATQQTQQLANASNQAAAAATNQAEATGNVDRSLQGLIVSSVAAAAAVGAIFAQGTEDFVRFDNAIRTVAAVSGESELAISQFRERAAELGSTTAESASSIAELGVQLTRAGFSTNQARQSLEGIIQTSFATGESLSTTGEIIGQVINQFEDVTAGAAETVGDQLVVAANSAQTTVSELGRALGFVGGTANGLNQSVEGTVTALALLARGGIRSGRAGRNLRQVFARLSNAAANNTEDFQALGVAVRDQNGDFRELIDLIPEIRENLASVGEGQANAITNRLFGIQGGEAFRALLRASNEEIASLEASINSAAGAGEQASDLIFGGLGGSIDELRSASEGASIVIGEVLEPAISDLISAAAGVLQFFTALPRPVQSTIVLLGALAGALALATAATASFTLISRTFTLAKVAESVAIAFNTQVLTANAVATGILSALNVNLLAIFPALARAIAAGTVALVNNAFAIGLVINAVATLAITVGLAVAAYQVWRRALQGLSDAGEEQRQVTEGLIEANRELTEVAEEASEIDPILPPPQNIFDEVILQLRDIRNTARAAREETGRLGFGLFIPNFLTEATRGEKQINDIRVAIGETSDAANEFATSALNFAVAFSNNTNRTAEDFERARAIQEALNESIAGLRERLEALDETEIGTQAFDDLTNQLEVQIAAQERVRASFERVTGIFDEGSEAAQQLEVNIEALAQAFDELNSVAESRALAEQVSIQEDLTEGIITQSEATRQLAEIERILAQERLANAEAFRDELLAIQEASPIENPIVTQALADQEAVINQRRIEVAEETRNAIEATEEARVDALERSLERQQQLFEEENNERLRARNQLVSDLIEAGADEAQIDLEVRVAEADDSIREIEQLIALEEQRLASAEEGSDAAIDAERQLDNLRTDLSAAELQRIRIRRDAREAAIQRELDAETEALEIAEATREAIIRRQQSAVEASLAVFDQIERTLEVQNSLLSAQAALTEARNELTQTIANTEVNAIERAIAARERLDSGAVASAKEREALERDILNAGFGSGVRRERLERELTEEIRQRAEIEQENLARTQAQEQAAFEIESRRNQLALQRQQIEQEIAIIQQTAAIAATEFELRRLQLTGEALQAELSITQNAQERERIQNQIQLNQLAQENARFELSTNQQILGQQEDLLNLSQQQVRAQQAAEDAQRNILQITQANATLTQAERIANEARDRAIALGATDPDRGQVIGFSRSAERFARDQEANLARVRRQAERVRDEVDDAPDLAPLQDELDLLLQKQLQSDLIGDSNVRARQVLDEQISSQQQLLDIERERVRVAGELSDVINRNVSVGILAAEEQRNADLESAQLQEDLASLPDDQRQQIQEQLDAGQTELAQEQLRQSLAQQAALAEQQKTQEMRDQVEIQRILIETEQERLSIAQDTAATINNFQAGQTSVPVNQGEIPAFAEGGSHQGGVAITGERGPEIGVHPRGSHFISHGEARRLAMRAFSAQPKLANRFTPSPQSITPRRIEDINQVQSNVNTARMEGLLTAQVNSMQSMIATEKRVANGISRMRREQTRLNRNNANNISSNSYDSLMLSTLIGGF